MKGIILKDLYIIKRYLRQYVIVLAFMLVWAVLMQSVTYAYIYLILLGAMQVFTVCSIDESVGFWRLALTMPINVRTLVASKYMLFLITTGIGVGISMLVDGAGALLYPQMHADFHWKYAIMIVTMFTLGIAMGLPVIFWKGVEKARYTIMAAMFAMGGLVWFLVRAGVMRGILVDDLVERISGGLYVAFNIMIWIGVLMISYLISLRLVKNKGW